MPAAKPSTAGRRTLDTLSDDVLFAILTWLDAKSLLALAQVCWNLTRVASADVVWRRIAAHCVNIRATSCRLNRSWKSLCRVSNNWTNRRCRDLSVLRFRTGMMPCIQLTGPKELFISRGPDVIQLQKTRFQVRGSPWQQQQILTIHQDGDVCYFVVKSGQLVSGGDDCTVQVWDLESGCCDGVLRGHTDRVNSVDFDEEVVVSGSRDKTVKVWSAQRKACMHTVLLPDPVWCVGLNPASRVLISGSSGHSTAVAPLQMWDVDSGQLVRELKTSHHRRGAGVFAVKWETPSTLLSCGYDTAVRLWDTRLIDGICQEWEDPHDSTVYCLDSDGQWMILSGTNRYGVVRIWDRRWDKCVQSFYVGRNCRSPVYSLQADQSNLFVALANGLRRLDFSV